MTIQECERLYLSRKEAATYLSRKWLKITVATLAKYATLGIGPNYINVGTGKGGRSLYTKADLDRWAMNPDRGHMAKAMRKALEERGALASVR